MDVAVLARGDYRFPDPVAVLSDASREGLVAVSRDLEVERLLAAYPRGIFPWFTEQGYFYWFVVAPRTVLLPPHLHIGRSLRKSLRHKPYVVTVNQNFSAVIAACAQTPRAGQPGSWISPEFQSAYCRLYAAGHAHSFECWYPADDGRLTLAGGLYGVQIGRVFFGESMFAWQNDASKIAFARAVPFLADCGVELVDCQQNTEHLARFGSEQMPFDQFQLRLNELTGQPLLKAPAQQIIYSTIQL